MPPIPIHKNAPIAPTTAAGADGVTPSTASLDTNVASNPPPTRTTPAYVPATTTQSSSSASPPAPQPGARPVAPTQAAGAGYGGGSYDGTPAAPQPGPTATVLTTEMRQAIPPPSQFNHPPPSDSMLAGRSTTTATEPSKPGPTTLNYGPAASPFQTTDSGNAVVQPTGTSLEHPPGYVQAPDNAPYAVGGGLDRPSGAGEGAEGEGVGAQAWQMLSKAGEALKKGEETVWRAVNNKNGGGF
ncbi:hypothetical protein CFE70_007541 [Pyrenophora teres f. teres 0-1]|uniref:Uncharacterized protein n=2 Tax=Pyrenophora teres f. teres TaxID=97479 RepID=E3S361_PYRTT|nr:hypothetical protein PTT_16861 [Pyrenophora teres f. teres 0-1]KAE8825479.1 hypothetical protein HRS9139_08589 [Pyrenophora teres f. teres]KAE8834575.1 hypothetical protein PTNB85_05908 [Pyrenophora teres f. teres]KAE8843945.1 hypothetical protein HRS9122_05048 [Pyrenophora teres f. teres]KAE8858999.1 hypothetical protein PTNB73_08479 [Pyrenophora teres f. teres]